MTRRSWALFAAMCVVWGIPFLLIRVAVRDVDPGTLVFARTALGGLVLLPFALRRGGFGPVLRRWRTLVVFSAIGIAMPWLMLGVAERHLSSSLTGLLVAAVPLVGVVVAWATRADDRGGGWLRYTGLLLGVAGVSLLVGLDFGTLHVVPLVEVLGAVIGGAVGPVIMARRLGDLPGILVVCASLFVVALGYLPYAAFHRPDSLSMKTGLSVVALGIVCTALAFVGFFALIGAIGPSRATVITYVNPAVAVALGVLLLNEKFTLAMGIGFPLILIGSVLAARRYAPSPGPAPAVPEGGVVSEEPAQAASVKGCLS
jgi:drug/metabolite transporter (DMT)-like permease